MECAGDVRLRLWSESEEETFGEFALEPLDLEGEGVLRDVGLFA